MRSWHSGNPSASRFTEGDSSTVRFSNRARTLRFASAPVTASPRQRWDNGPVNTLTPILSSPGWELLESLQARQETNPMPLRELGAALRASGIEASLAAAVLTQLALRQAARAEFGPFA